MLGNVLITGASGFIGFHLCSRLMDEGNNVVGVDNLNDYYDVNLKLDRVNQIMKKESRGSFQFLKLDIADKETVSNLFEKREFEVVVNLAAQAGVRCSLGDPHA